MTFSGNHPETLNGVRVLDLTRLLPGPLCTSILSDLGADVVKLEDTRGGDWARWLPPFFGEGPTAIGALFSALNRGKRSLAIDLKHEEGANLFRDLVGQADVLVESFRPGVMARLGLAPETLLELNPSLIYCAITGYGQEGTMSQKAGHDLNYLALSGALEQTGSKESGPLPAGFQAADVVGGSLFGALSILAALYHRQRTGQGASLDIAMADGAAALMAPVFARIRAGEGEIERGRDVLTGGFPCYRVYETADQRHMALAALEPKFWKAFCEAVGHLGWVSLGHQQDSPIAREIEALFRSRKQSEWIALFEPLDVCCEPVLSPAQVLESQWLEQRRLCFWLGGGQHARSLQTATAVTPPENRHLLRPPPLLGEHTRELLLETGIDPQRISTLVASGVVKTTDRISD